MKLLYTEGAVVLAMSHVLLPFMVLPIYSALQGIPQDYTRAAQMLGASRMGDVSRGDLAAVAARASPPAA